MLNNAETPFVFLSMSWSWLNDAFEIFGSMNSLAVLGAFVLFFAMEARGGYRKNPNRITRQSYLTNLGTFLMNDTLMSLMSVSSILILAEHHGHWGLLRLIPDPFTRAVLSLLMLDLSLYMWHRANHTFDSLWMFHKVHHSDPSMNVTTAFRLHFVELVLTTVIKAVLVLVTGMEAAVFLANEGLITLMIMFHHSNISFKGERFLGGLMIVPRLHRVHHSTLRREHDNNYGALLSIWDRMFGTLLDKEPAVIGLDSVPGLGVLELVKYGLTKKWISSVKQIVTNPQLVQKMIAEAAYYRAKARGFAPGNEFKDWLEAEKEILSRLPSSKSASSFLSCCGK